MEKLVSLTLSLVVLVSLFSVSSFAEKKTLELREADSGISPAMQRDLFRRMRDLERTVDRMHDRIRDLERNRGRDIVVTRRASNKPDSWVCTVSPFTRTYSATGGSKAVAKSRVISKCAKGEDSDFHCKDPECEN